MLTHFNLTGIDDVFVLVNMLRNYLVEKRIQAVDSTISLVPQNEMRLTVSHAGPSVVLTTFSVLASFFISSVVSFFSFNNHLSR